MARRFRGRRSRSFQNKYKKNTSFSVGMNNSLGISSPSSFSGPSGMSFSSKDKGTTSFRRGSSFSYQKQQQAQAAAAAKAKAEAQAKAKAEAAAKAKAAAEAKAKAAEEKRVRMFDPGRLETNLSATFKSPAVQNFGNAASNWYNKGRLPNESKMSIRDLLRNDLSQQQQTGKFNPNRKLNLASYARGESNPFRGMPGYGTITGQGQVEGGFQTGPTPSIRQAIERPLNVIGKIGSFLKNPKLAIAGALAAPTSLADGTLEGKPTRFDTDAGGLNTDLSSTFSGDFGGLNISGGVDSEDSGDNTGRTVSNDGQLVANLSDAQERRELQDVLNSGFNLTDKQKKDIIDKINGVVPLRKVSVPNQEVAQLAYAGGGLEIGYMDETGKKYTPSPLGDYLNKEFNFDPNNPYAQPGPTPEDTPESDYTSYQPGSFYNQSDTNMNPTNFLRSTRNLITSPARMLGINNRFTNMLIPKSDEAIQDSLDQRGPVTLTRPKSKGGNRFVGTQAVEQLPLPQTPQPAAPVPPIIQQTGVGNTNLQNIQNTAYNNTMSMYATNPNYFAQFRPQQQRFNQRGNFRSAFNRNYY